jgi:hypothetical protein
MSLHRLRFDSAHGLPRPVALALYVGAVAALAWSVHDYAQMPNGQGGASPRAQPWRPAASKWSRAPATDEKRIAVAADAAQPAVPALPTTGGLESSTTDIDR